MYVQLERTRASFATRCRHAQAHCNTFIYSPATHHPEKHENIRIWQNQKLELESEGRVPLYATPLMRARVADASPFIHRAPKQPTPKCPAQLTYQRPLVTGAPLPARPPACRARERGEVGLFSAATACNGTFSLATEPPRGFE